MSPEIEQAVLENLASLNEIVFELVAQASSDTEFTVMVRETLREHSHRLGFSFCGDRP